MPALRSRPDLFPPENFDRWYTLERYHIIGSRILSRSFQVEQWDNSSSDGEDDGVPQPDAEHSDGMEQNHDPDPDDEDNGDSGDVAMVPMADMLNARFGCNNV